tara:strand:- start:533 stop:1318 length:786 start_codon:yes stop_codon:yes gene_type:complete
VKDYYQNKYLVDVFASIMFFTRIPINWPFFSDKAPNLTRAAWSFPLVGFLIGILSGILGELLILINVPTYLSCVIAIAISVLITGAFHEDGLADMADGFGAGGTPKKINEIMHDSRLGTYGTAALTLGLLIRLGLLICLVDLGYSLLIILSIGFASGKLAIIFMRNLYHTSSLAKTGSIIETVSTKKILFASLIWFVPVFSYLPFLAILSGTILMIIVVFFIGRMSRQKLDGITGDVLGATAFLSELAFLFGLVIYLSGLI